MPYQPAAVPADPLAVHEFLQSELQKIAQEINNPNPAMLRFQPHTSEPGKPRAGDVAYFPSVPGAFSPGGGPGLYWFDSQVWRVFAGLSELGLLAGTADQVLATSTPQVITNYSAWAASDNVTVDPVAGTILLPNVSGWLKTSVWFVVNQVTAIKDFTIDLNLGVDSVVQDLIASAYVPQQSADVDLVLSAALTRPVAGGELIDMRLSSTKNATIDILNSSVEVTYLVADQGSGVDGGGMIDGEIP